MEFDWPYTPKINGKQFHDHFKMARTDPANFEIMTTSRRNSAVPAFVKRPLQRLATRNTYAKRSEENKLNSALVAAAKTKIKQKKVSTKAGEAIIKAGFTQDTSQKNKGTCKSEETSIWINQAEPTSSQPGKKGSDLRPSEDRDYFSQ
ncbi:MAG: hypothetical protein WCK77_23690 [Verrucomicrobiota bacterium]